jgi:hypothetical protein
VIWRFVIRQHQTMSYEREFGGVATAICLSLVALMALLSNDAPLAEQAFLGGETHFLAVAQTVAFCLASSKMLYLSMGVD